MPEATMLSVLLAEREIMRQLNIYCRASDRCDTELLATVYHDDAYEDHGDTFRGPASEYVALLGEFVKGRFVAMQHTLSNVIIDVDGDTARSESYAVAHMASASGDGSFTLNTFGCRYLDKWENRVGAGWRIAHRITVADWQTLQPMVAPSEQAPGYIRGQQDRTDPVYAEDLPVRTPLEDSAIARAAKAALGG